MRINKILLSTLFGLGISFSCCADPAEAGDNAAEQPSEYLDSNEITEDDYNMMMDYATRYDQCLNEKSFAEINNYNDPRHVVDTAMKQCAFELEELNQQMSDRKFPPIYRQKFIQRTSNRAAGDTLRIIMMEMASRQTPSE
ncbi:MAG: hypothetical protein HY356_06990 [Gammaproteobacteria bacterium]|nr:hypothetical protein [Gammaproteobacteria bacterium]